MSSAPFRAAFASFVVRSIKKTFEVWTVRIPLNPRRVKALWTLSPSGSVTPFFRRTSTRTRTIPLTCRGHRLRPLRPFQAPHGSDAVEGQIVGSAGETHDRTPSPFRRGPWSRASAQLRERCGERSLGRRPSPRNGLGTSDHGGAGGSPARPEERPSQCPRLGESEAAPAVDRNTRPRLPRGRRPRGRPS